MFRKRRVYGLLFAVVAVACCLLMVWLFGTIESESQTALQSPAPQQVDPSPTPMSKEAIIEDVNRKLGRFAVTVTLHPENNESSYSTWTELTDDVRDVKDLQEFAGYLVAEFSKYPKDLVENSNLQTIGIVRDLKVVGTSRASVPIPTLNSMVYDAPQEVSGGKDYASSGISHEYWHFLDYRIRGDYRYADAEWSACNPTGFTYGDGGETAYTNPDFTNAFYDRKGFITEYATYGIEEDRAEMFAWLMYSPDRVKGLNDTGIECKVKRLTSIVRALSPQMTF